MMSKKSLLGDGMPQQSIIAASFGNHFPNMVIVVVVAAVP
jgi:hypothetical protein